MTKQKRDPDMIQGDNSSATLTKEVL